MPASATAAQITAEDIAPGTILRTACGYTVRARGINESGYLVCEDVAGRFAGERIQLTRSALVRAVIVEVPA